MKQQLENPLYPPNRSAFGPISRAMFCRVVLAPISRMSAFKMGGVQSRKRSPGLPDRTRHMAPGRKLAGRHMYRMMVGLFLGTQRWKGWSRAQLTVES